MSSKTKKLIEQTLEQRASKATAYATVSAIRGSVAAYSILRGMATGIKVGYDQYQKETK